MQLICLTSCLFLVWKIWQKKLVSSFKHFWFLSVEHFLDHFCWIHIRYLISFLLLLLYPTLIIVEIYHMWMKPSADSKRAHFRIWHQSAFTRFSYIERFRTTTRVSRRLTWISLGCVFEMLSFWFKNEVLSIF